MRGFLLTLSILCLSFTGIAHAQAPQKVISWYDYPEAELRALDKITAESTTFKVKVGKPVKFGKVFMKVQACRKPPAIDKLESAAFVQVWEKTPKDTKSKWVFSGWRFGSSPSLSAMDHPIYDVWLLNCIGEELTEITEEIVEEAVEETQELGNEEEKKSSFNSMLDSLED